MKKNRYTKDEIECLLFSELHCQLKCECICQLMDELNLSYIDARNRVDTDYAKTVLNTKCANEVKSTIDKIGNDEIIVMIEHGDGGHGEDGVLEHDILPRLLCTRASFSHH